MYSNSIFQFKIFIAEIKEKNALKVNNKVNIQSSYYKEVMFEFI